MSATEILNGVINNLGIILSHEEQGLLVNYIDKDGNGLISEQEFTDKINLNEFKQRLLKYTISQKSFTDVVQNELLIFYGQERKRIINYLMKFDENGDRLFQFEEFANLLQEMEPRIEKQFALKLFKRTQSMQASTSDDLCVETLTTMIA